MLNRQSPSSSVKSLCPLYSTYSSSSYFSWLLLFSSFLLLQLLSPTSSLCSPPPPTVLVTSGYRQRRLPAWGRFYRHLHLRASGLRREDRTDAFLVFLKSMNGWVTNWKFTAKTPRSSFLTDSPNGVLCDLLFILFFFMSIFFLFTSPLGLVTLYQSWLGRLLNVFIVSASRNYLISASISPYPLSVLHSVLIRLSKIISIYWRILFLNMEFFFFNFPSIFQYFKIN